MLPRDVAVIGAGPAGITAAYQLAKAGVKVTVFEASPFVGGMARSFELWGQRVDLGPHRFFSSDARVNRLWLEVVGADYRMVDRVTRILYNGKQFHYPLRAGEALAKLGPIEAARCLASYAHARLSPPHDTTTFEGWVVSRFGRRLFEIFFQTYSEKLWGIGCDELDADFAAQRIKRLSLIEAIRAAVVGDSGGHKTLVDRFAYPIAGTGAVYERMAASIRERGGTVRLATPVRAIEPAAQRVVTEDGLAHAFDHVISSMPLTVMASRLPSVPDRVIAATRALAFRNTILVYLHVDSPDLFRDQWLYIHTPGLATGRITNFRNWVPELYGAAKTSILALEYWCDDGDPSWSSTDAALIATAKRDFAHTGLGGGSERPVLDARVVRVPRCYPVYRRGYRDHLAVIVDYLRGISGLQVIGRYGAFKYNNQDHSILMGLLAADNTLGAAHDLWAINTDYEYQEAATIDETGLRTMSSRRA